MKLVAGLGNPGPRYARTRHNVGFGVADTLALRRGARIERYEARFEGLLEEIAVGGERVLLLKPMTMMNLSGRSVAAVVRFYKLPASDLMVVYDDLDLPVGGLRIRANGSSGGHNGMTDILRSLGTQDVARMRIGIGSVHRSDTVDHVLGRFAPDEQAAIDETIGRTADAVECWATEGLTPAMNKFNRRGDGRTKNEDSG